VVGRTVILLTSTSSGLIDRILYNVSNGVRQNRQLRTASARCFAIESVMLFGSSNSVGLEKLR